MKRYELAKIVEWAGSLYGRKRMQKVVFLLKAAGCPIEADYTLHHYGPYSPEVARISDEMVQVGLLDESSRPNRVGVQYTYKLTKHAETSVSEFEQTSQGKDAAALLAPYETKAKELLNTYLAQLEVASTLVYFRQQGYGWSESIERTCKFKNLDPSSYAKILQRVEELARQFIT